MQVRAKWAVTVCWAVAAASLALAQPFEIKAIDGEGERCPLDEVVISEPPDGAKIYLGPSAGPIDLGVRAQVSCVSDTANVEFFVKRPSDSTRLAIGVDIDEPYTTTLRDVLPSGSPQEFTFTAEATRKSDEDEVISGTAVVSIVQAGTTQDADGNALPDAPFAVLASPGSRWLASGGFTGASADLIAAALVLYGDDAKQSGNTSASITLAPPEGDGQSVRVEVPGGLVAEDEVGLLIVAAAVDLGSLVGTIEETEFAREPSGQIVEGSLYTAVHLLVTDDAGETFSQAPASRLTGNPIKVTVADLALEDDGREYVLAQHVGTVAETASGIQLRHAVGTWRQPPTQALDPDTGTFTADLTAFGIVAPYFLVEDTSICGEDGCPPALLWIELLLLLAFGILNLADGGVGGGDGPCFIATAAYGTPLAAEIDVLREFRDESLLSGPLGTAFVDAYYRLSPPLADAVAQSPALAALVRAALAPVTILLNDTPGLRFSALLMLVFVAWQVCSRRAHCIPKSRLEGDIPGYDTFLDLRRKLMAQKIKAWFERL